MKKHWMIALILVLTLSLFTGCGCTNSKNPAGMNPTGMTTTPTAAPTTMPTTAPTTMPTTAPTEQATFPTENVTPGTEGMMPDGTNGTDGSAPMDGTDNTTPTQNNRARARTVR